METGTTDVNRLGKIVSWNGQHKTDAYEGVFIKQRIYATYTYYDRTKEKTRKSMHCQKKGVATLEYSEAHISKEKVSREQLFQRQNIADK